MQIPILDGIYTNDAGDFRTSYPRNLVPVPKKQGISNGYLRPGWGLVSNGTGPGTDRGGINWNGVCYRVMGSSLVSIDASGNTTTIGTVTGSDLVTFDYSFDYLSVSGGGNLYLYDGSTLAQVTDTDLGTVIDHIWIDGYFMTTDGENLVVTELSNPFSVDPLKYGSSEVDPDPVNGLHKIDNEAYAINRHTIEVFTNTPSSGFPFQRIEGAQIQKGAFGTKTACVFEGNIAFLGSGRMEAPGVYVARGGQSGKISTQEIDQILQEFTETQLSQAQLEAKIDKNHKHLLLHLPDRTLVYDESASFALQVPVWFTLTTSLRGNSKYRARNLVWCYNKWLVGDPLSSTIGYFSDDVSSHYGVENGWDFGTTIVYNEGRSAIFHQLELVALAGRAALGVNPTVWTEYSKDGMSWSGEEGVSTGKQGDRDKRIVWFEQGMMDNFRLQRFRGTSESHMGIARLEAQLEGLLY